MKKLILVIALGVSGFGFSQFIEAVDGHRQYDKKVLIEHNYNNYCSIYIRDAFERDSVETLGLSKTELAAATKCYTNFLKVNGSKFKRVRDLTPLMSYGDYLDSKVNYNPFLNFGRMGNSQIVTIIPIKSLSPKYKAIELVEYYSMFRENTNLTHFTTIFVQLPDGVWEACCEYMYDETLECPPCNVID